MSESPWDSWPKLDPKLLLLLNLTPKDTEKNLKCWQERRNDLIIELGPLKGNIRFIQEMLEIVATQLKIYKEYYEKGEAWKRKVQQEYILIRENSDTAR